MRELEFACTASEFKGIDMFLNGQEYGSHPGFDAIVIHVAEDTYRYIVKQIENNKYYLVTD